MYCLSLIQTKYGLITRTLPGVLSKLAVNYLSRKFAVTFTEVGPRFDDDALDDAIFEEDEVKKSLLYYFILIILPKTCLLAFI